eukprot:1929597-Amphidinium_carterae.1
MASQAKYRNIHVLICCRKAAWGNDRIEVHRQGQRLPTTTSDVRCHGEKWLLMYDCGAVVSIAPPSFATHVRLIPINSEQRLQTITNENRKDYGSRHCTLITRGIGLKVIIVIIIVMPWPIIGTLNMA